MLLVLFSLYGARNPIRLCGILWRVFASFKKKNHFFTFSVHLYHSRMFWKPVCRGLRARFSSNAGLMRCETLFLLFFISRVLVWGFMKGTILLFKQFVFEVPDPDKSGLPQKWLTDFCFHFSPPCSSHGWLLASIYGRIQNKRIEMLCWINLVN